MSNNLNNTKGFLIGFLAGGTIGAIIALLITPKSGKELRGDIKHKSEDYYDDVDNYYTEKKNKASEILKDAEKAFETAKDILQSGKEKIEVETDSLKYSFKTGVDGNDENKKI